MTWEEEIVCWAVWYNYRRKPWIVPVESFSNLEQKQLLYDKSEAIENYQGQEEPPCVLFCEDEKNELRHDDDINHHPANDHKSMQVFEVCQEVFIRICEDVKS